MPFWNLHFFLGGWMSEKNYPAHHHFPTPPKFLAPFQKGVKPMGFSASFLATPPTHRTVQDEYESTYGIQEVDNGIKMGFVTTTKYHGMQERQPCHMLAANFVGCLTGLSNCCCMVSSIYIDEISCQASSFNEVDDGHRLACS